MNRYVLLEIAYSTVAIPVASSAELGLVLAALASARTVKSIGSGADETFVAETNDAPKFRVVDESKAPLGDELASLRARIAAAEKELEQRNGWWMQEREKNTALKKEVDALKAGQQPVAA